MIQEFLRGASLFKDLGDEDLAQILMVGMVKRYSEGAHILTEGAVGGHLHLIHEGKVRISKVLPGAGEEALAILEPGDFFGEVEFFDGGPASANAIAHTDCAVFQIPHREMEDFIKSRPEVSARFLWAFGATLARRLRDTNHKMATLFAISRTF